MSNALTLVILANLARSRVGRNWRAIRDDPVAAALAGLPVGRLRVLAFIVSAACAGLAGAMLAVTTSLVSPGSFTLSLSIALLAGAVLGGLGTLTGALWGALVIVLVPTYVTDVATSHGFSGGVAANIPAINKMKPTDNHRSSGGIMRYIPDASPSERGFCAHLENRRDTVTRSAPFDFFDRLISIPAAASWLASNSRSAESQCSAARPSSRPVAFQMS